MVLLARLFMCLIVFTVMGRVLEGTGLLAHTLWYVVSLILTWWGVGRLLRRDKTPTSFHKPPTGHRPTTTAPPRRPTTPTMPTIPGRIYGSPGTSISGGTVTFGEQNTATGVEGEVRTGKILDQVHRQMPYLTVFHSLEWPGSKTSDIDHAVLARTANGREVLLLIDSKMWKWGNYTWDGVVPMRDGERMHPIFFASGNPQYNLPSAADSMRRRLSGVTVQSVVVMHGARSVRTLGHPLCAMVTPDELPAYLAGLYAGGGTSTNQGVLSRLVSMLK